ncbi:MAG: radical SAM protein [Candidatus Omnitrophica bacterium]|nr:radical SAM protein [Candidatus Omnitrophota bacterium]
MKKILLLDPLGFRVPSGRHFHPLRDWTGSYIIGDIPSPPMDLMYAAAHVRRKGHEVKIIEGNVNHWGARNMARIVRRESPDCVLIPSTYFSLAGDKQLAACIKEEAGEVKIIFSGPPVTYDPASVLNEGAADFAVLGELELPLADILEGKYEQNVAYREDGKIVRTERVLFDLNGLLPAARDLVNNASYRYAFFNKQNPVTVMAVSRGCAHSKCGFCPSALYNSVQVRYRDFSSIAGELEEIVLKYGIREIFFKDQTFTANRELVMKMCEYMISHDLRLFWRATTRVDMVDKELLSFMRRAGCYQISFGFENSSQESLDKANKGITVEQSRKAALWSKDAGLEVLGFFMFGLMGDTEKSMADVYTFSRELDVDYAIFDMAYILPGTPYYEKSKEDPSVFLSPDMIRRYAGSAFVRFNLRPEFVFKQLKRIHSFSDFKFLAGVGWNAVKAYIS